MTSTKSIGVYKTKSSNLYGRTNLFREAYARVNSTKYSGRNRGVLVKYGKTK